jgi:Tol biopolymer transport system component
MRILAIFSLLLLLACGSTKKKPEQDEQKVVSTTPTEVVSEKKEVPNGWQSIDVRKLEIDGYYPFFGPDDQSVLYTTSTYQGIWSYDLQSNEEKQLTDKEGAGFEPKINGDSLIYQVRGRAKYLEAVSLTSGEVLDLGKPRGVSPGSYARMAKKADVSVKLANDLTGIELSVDGESKVISPQGQKNYISVSLSPDKTRLLYKVAGVGAFVSDLSGETIKELGDVDQSSWVSDDLILYAKSEDDGMQTLNSKIYVLELETRTKYELKAEGVSLENPKADKTGSKIVANSPEGHVYLFTQNKGI